MTKGADAFRSIGEVARLLGVAPHVLRYWETQFPLLKPMKRPDGRRYYRPDDVRLAAGLCTVLRDDGLTIRGAKRLLARDRGAVVRERGMARLADLDGSMPDIQMTDVDEIDLDGQEFAAVDVSRADGDDDVAHKPRSRHRRRHGAELSLPNGTGAARQPAGWLAEVVALNALLRDLDPADAAEPHHRAALSRLRDALARMC